MGVCITASRIMTAAEVSKQCKQVMESEVLLMMLELSIKKEYLKTKKRKVKIA